MRTSVASLLAALVAQQVAGHATFQQFWVNGIDQGGSCVRTPLSNSPVTDVTGTSIRCNANKGSALTKCSVTAGTTVTVEIHQQAGDRSCANEPIGGAHYGPVMVYLTSVADAATADGSTGWFKIFEDSWARAPGSANGDGDYWGVKDLTPSCGRMDVKIPTNIPSGDYLLRAEAIALHTAGSVGGAQFYMSCYQISVTGGSGTLPPTVLFPGAYKATDPGIKVDIHASMATYIAPGPTVVAGGTVKTAGTPGSNISGGGNYVTTIVQPAPTAAPGGGSGSGCTAAKYEQCGGQGFTGCTTCASGSTCKEVSGIYYSQCQ